MDIIDNERNLIKERMEQIRENKRSPKEKQYKIVIAAGEPVLKDDEQEFRALARMLELLEYGLKEKFAGEYDKLRGETKLEGVEESISDKINPKTPSEEKKDEAVRNDTPHLPLEEQFSFRIEPTATAVSPKKEELSSASIKALPKQGTQDALLNDYMNDVLQNNLYNQNGKPAIDQNLQSVEVDIVPKKPKDAAYFERIKSGAIEADYVPIEETQDHTPFFSDAPTEKPSFAPNMNSLPPHNAEQSFPSIVKTSQKQTSNEDSNNNITTDDDLIEVESVTPWQRIKEHKKQILIGLGLTAITIAIIVAITQVLPAFLAASQAATEASILASNASQVSSLANIMSTNSALWHGASAAEQVALHSANVATANLISGLTNSVATFDSLLGSWTIGGQTVAQFAASTTAAASQAATVAAAAASKVAALSNAVLGTTIGGIGLVGAGALLPKSKSKEYKSFRASIKNLVNAAPSLSKVDRNKTAESLKTQIATSSKLSNDEKKILYRKLQTAIKKMNKMKDSVTPLLTSLPDNLSMDDHNLKVA